MPLPLLRSRSRRARTLGIAAAVLGLASLAASAPRDARAQADDFVILFAGPDDFQWKGTDYTVVVQHVGTGPGLKAFTFGYAATGGSLHGLDVSGSDAGMALNDPFSTLESDVSDLPPGLCSKVIDSLEGTGSQLEWELDPMTASTMGLLRVRAPNGNVASPVVLRIANDLTCPTFTSPSFPVVTSRVCERTSFGSTTNACAAPNDALRRLRPNNLVAGAEFDTSLAGWSTTGLDSAALDVLDVDASTTSSSVRVVLSTPVDGATGSLGSPCVPVLGGADYAAGGSIQASLGQARAGTAGIEVRFHDDATCTSPIATTTRVDATPGAAFDAVVLAATSPPSAASAEVLCTVEVAGTSSAPFLARCDSIFVPEPGAGAASAAGLAMLGAIAARRRTGAAR
ncbi:MAG: hypothetical protein KC560_19540 [Myxococcales bacterium]|nr:hypothetical protein [Myxococcales bacterium]